MIKLNIELNKCILAYFLLIKKLKKNLIIHDDLIVAFKNEKKWRFKPQNRLFFIYEIMRYEI